MACPHVAGLAALFLSVAPGFTNEQITDRIIGTTDNIDEMNPEYSGFLGSGRINASRTVHVYDHNIGVSSLSVSDALLGHPGETITVETTIVNSGIHSEHNISVILIRL
jgi:subtilisin family serine protease